MGLLQGNVQQYRETHLQHPGLHNLRNFFFDLPASPHPGMHLFQTQKVVPERELELTVLPQGCEGARLLLSLPSQQIRHQHSHVLPLHHCNLRPRLQKSFLSSHR